MVGVRWGVLVVGLIVLALMASSWLGIILTIVVVLLLEGFLSFMTGQWPFHERESDETTRPERSRGRPRAAAPAAAARARAASREG